MMHRKAVFTAQQLNRARHLLDMRCRPSELAEELQVCVETVYHSYLAEGCPHERDGKAHIWINGAAFYQWACARGGRKRVKLAEGQAYCFHCKKPVNMVEVSTATITNRHLEVVTGRCPECESKVSRGRARRDQS